MLFELTWKCPFCALFDETCAFLAIIIIQPNTHELDYTGINLTTLRTFSFESTRMNHIHKTVIFFTFFSHCTCTQIFYQITAECQYSVILGSGSRCVHRLRKSATAYVYNCVWENRTYLQPAGFIFLGERMEAEKAHCKRAKSLVASAG